MKIAMIAPIAWRTPPRAYGPWELVTSLLTEALVALSVLNLLGLGFLTGQWQALRAQRDALSSQLAVAMAQDLWHRMQVHPAAWPWYCTGRLLVTPVALIE